MKCPTCKGEGSIERNIPGNEGVPEQDIMIQCPDCGGIGIIPDMDIEEEDYRFTHWDDEEE